MISCSHNIGAINTKVLKHIFEQNVCFLSICKYFVWNYMSKTGLQWSKLLPLDTTCHLIVCKIVTKCEAVGMNSGRRTDGCFPSLSNETEITSCSFLSLKLYFNNAFHPVMWHFFVLRKINCNIQKYYLHQNDNWDFLKQHSSVISSFLSQIQ